MNNSLLTEILKLNVSERIQLVEDIWDSISTATSETIYIIACFHVKRDPQQWKRRLS